MDPSEIRRLVIVAMFSDDFLFDRLVLKGGNAISLVYGYGNRSSLDIDFSMPDEFDDLENVQSRIFRALQDRFDASGYVVFDYSFEQRPAVPGPTTTPKWGGYAAKFKLIEKPKFEVLGHDSDAMRRSATVLGPLEQRTFTIEISKWEFCTGKTEAEIDRFSIFVYTPPMLAIEKLRAVCQQMPEYRLRTYKTARARDFYDLWILITEASVDLGTPESLDLARHIFSAKDVPLPLIGRIGDYREFHRQDWPAVVGTVNRDLREFDFYFDFVLRETNKLQPLWEV